MVVCVYDEVPAECVCALPAGFHFLTVIIVYYKNNIVMVGEKYGGTATSLSFN